MRLALVRHGQTAHNADGLTLGRHDVPLNGHGRAQAEALAAAFTAAPDAIYTSPLARARETAGLIAARFDAAAAIDDDLIEMDVGEMEHLTRDELRERYPDFVREWLSGDAGDARMPGGETLREVQERAWGAIERMREAHPRGLVVAVTHNFVILTLVSRALGIELAGFRRIRAGLASRSVLEVSESGCSLLQLNDHAHLVAAGLAEDLYTREVRP
jgi:broad specificity phosphatase PhoE